MRVKNLRGIMRSNVCNVQMVVIWDNDNSSVIDKCSVEHMINVYGSYRVERIYTHGEELVVSIEDKED